ncbi:MAG: sensor domain-containing diguanylate cyclase, partial [Vallitaleaceae bacterium]|nr:sensor domain-containing diguanylate cyclase [Vallitaleaceae bacterium]
MKVKIENLDEKMKNINSKFDELIQMKKDAVVWKKALRITLLYTFIGSLWILLSDRILSILVTDRETMEIIQLFKGWFYVAVTALWFYFIIRKTLLLFDRASVMAISSFEELSAAHEELMAMTEEMDSQYQNLLEHQEALRASEERHALVVEGATDGIWDWNVVTGDYYFSKKWVEAFGYKEGELPERIESWQKLVHPQDVEKVNQTLSLYQNKKSGIYENVYRLRNKSGEYRYIQSRGKAVWDANGKPLRMAGSHTDITEKLLLEERLKELAYYDDLTGLPNRAYLLKEVTKAISNGEIPVLAAIDIDDFKHINDTMGHIEGDLFIIQVAAVLRRCVPEPHIV